MIGDPTDAKLFMAAETLPPGHAIYLKADVQALVDALAMALQHGRIDDSETRMNLAFAALYKFKESGNG